MTAKKREPSPKTKIKKEDLIRFTLPGGKDNVLSNTQKQSDFSEFELEQRRAEENSFWQGRTGKIWMAIFSVCILLSIAAGVFIHRTGSTKESNAINKTVSPAPSLEIKLLPSPTVEATVDVTKYTITVLNGSGVSGEAAKVKDLLENEGYTVSSIGNADRLTYKETLIQAKKNISKDYLDQLKKTLGRTYILDDLSELSQDEEKDIVIIIGRTKK